MSDPEIWEEMSWFYISSMRLFHSAREAKENQKQETVKHYIVPIKPEDKFLPTWPEKYLKKLNILSASNNKP